MSAQSISNCSTLNINGPTAEATKCSIPFPHFDGVHYPLTDSVTYHDTCKDDNTGQIYFSPDSTVSGNGECMFGNKDTTFQQCGLSIETDSVYSLVSGTPNAMYLKGWDQVLGCTSALCTDGIGYACKRCTLPAWRTE